MIKKLKIEDYDKNTSFFTPLNKKPYNNKYSGIFYNLEDEEIKKSVRGQEILKILTADAEISELKMDDKNYGPKLYELIKNSTLILNVEQMHKQQKHMISEYASDKIFNNDKPLITDILSPYIEKDIKKMQEESKVVITQDMINDIDKYNKHAIKDFKMFYLFGNYDDDQKTQFKCEHQIKLLDNTQNFIATITQ